MIQPHEVPESFKHKMAMMTGDAIVPFRWAMENLGSEMTTGHWGCTYDRTPMVIFHFEKLEDWYRFIFLYGDKSVRNQNS